MFIRCIFLGQVKKKCSKHQDLQLSRVWFVTKFGVNLKVQKRDKDFIAYYLFTNTTTLKLELKT